MTQTDTVRRHPNGSIDFDFYRAGATALRRQAMRDSATLRKAFAGALVTMGVLSLAVGFAALPRQSANTVTAAVGPAKTHPIYCSYPGASGTPSTPCWLVPSRTPRLPDVVAGWTMQAHTAANPL